MHAPHNENSDSEDEDYPLQASKLKGLRHPAKPFHRNEMNLDATFITEEDSEEEDYQSNPQKNSKKGVWGKTSTSI